MDSGVDSRKIVTTRHKCLACFKKYKKKEHLVGHMRASYHSIHQPRCVIFSEQGCSLCLKNFDSPAILDDHKEMCRLPPPAPLGMPCTWSEIHVSDPYDGDYSRTVAIDCEMVGGGSGRTLDLCARVCLIDEDENLIFHTYVQPNIHVTDYRYEVTSITEKHLRVAMPLSEVQGRLLEILYNEESTGRVGLDEEKARLLVDHDLEHDLACLGMKYPDHLQRYDIQSGVHDPLVDCVSAMSCTSGCALKIILRGGSGHPLDPDFWIS